MKLLLTEAYSRNSALTSAVKNRRVIKFYYAGPRSGKESVKPGNRLEVLPVAIGLTEGRGNMALRGWVKNLSSATKTGFEKGQWRTFLVSRLHQLEVTDEIFEREDLPTNYNPGDDGSFSTTYTTVDWDKRVYRKKFDPELSRRKQKEKDAELQRQKDAEIGAMGTMAGADADADVGMDVDVMHPDQPEDLPMPTPDERPPVDPEATPEPTPTATPDLNNPEDEFEPETTGDDEEEEDFHLQETINRIKCLISF